MSIDPDAAPARVTAGVDWAKDDHAVCAVGDQGEVLERFTVRHDAAGLRQLAARLLRAGAAQAGIERSDGPVADTLPDAGLTVFVIPPGQVKNLRSRYGSAGNKDDRFDACVLAGVVRTGARRLRPMERDTGQTTALRSAVRARRDLAGHRAAAASQLRAHLQIVFPAAAALFASIGSEITLAFLSRFTTQEQAGWLSPLRLAAWLKSAACSGKTDPAVLHARLLAAPRGKSGEHARDCAGTTLALAAVLRVLNAQIRVLAASIAAQLAARPDAAIFQSLPRSGTVRAARLPAETGDARGRFPTRDCDHPHAVRILARAWAHVIWRCWQDHVPCNPAAHNSLQALLKQRQPVAT